MIAKRMEDGYQFESPTTNGFFVVKLALGDDGKETIETCSTAVGVCFPKQDLTPGTIERVVGPKRWKNFLSMKEKGIEKMFIDPQRPKRRAHAQKTW